MFPADNFLSGYVTFLFKLAFVIILIYFVLINDNT